MKQHEKLTAIYCRTALPDDLSIFEQRDRLTRWANARGYDNLVYYQDNGYSGLDFERPVFSEMQKEIQVGNINCVLVVENSRIGRNNQLVSNWLIEMCLAGIAVITSDNELEKGESCMSLEGFDKKMEGFKNKESEIAKTAIQIYGSIEKYTHAMKAQLSNFTENMNQTQMPKSVADNWLE